MKPFQYFRPANLKEAISSVASNADARFIAGGTNLVDLMKRGVTSPGKLVDINHLPFKKIERKNGKLHIGALALNSDVARHPIVTSRFPVLAQALLAGASGQLRNMATVGGNMLQQTRCPYYYDLAFPCNRRSPGTGCAALGGINRMHAIFGTNNNRSCIAVHPGDMGVALSVLGADLLLTGPEGERRVAFTDLYRAPGDRPDLNTTLERSELITALEIPETSFFTHNHYLKIRDRASYAFAMVSVAAVLEIENNHIKAARLSLGGVAYKPWRLFDVEKQLTGQPVSESVFEGAAELAIKGAQAFEHNAYKLKLTANAIIQALKNAADIP